MSLKMVQRDDFVIMYFSGWERKVHQNREQSKVFPGDASYRHLASCYQARTYEFKNCIQEAVMGIAE